jgi:putative holliday junction resolvase
MRILAVDPGEKNIGLAISDPTGSIANPLQVLRHTARQADAQAIARIATQKQASLIVVGQNLDEEGRPTFEGRRSTRLAAAIRRVTELPVELWDESFSTKTAIQARRDMDVGRKQRQGHLDDIAATVILQSYLDSVNSDP